jgi:hypothetical protein
LRGEGLDDWAIRPKMGGLATLRSYGATGVSWSDLESQVWRIPDSHRAVLESLALVEETARLSGHLRCGSSDPPRGGGSDPREVKLAGHGIRVVNYQGDGAHSFRASG